MSGGRVELGLGAGWFEQEHAAYGIPFPDTRERFDRFEEQLAVITGLWATAEGELFSHAGEALLADRLPGAAQAGPATRPAGAHRRHGASGVRRRWRRATPRSSTCRSSPRRSPRPSSAGCAQACEEIGRDPDELTYSNALVLCCGATDADVRRRADVIGQDVDELRANGLAGTPAEVVDRIGRFAELGAERVYLQTLDVDDLDHLELVAAEVMPKV